MILDKLNLAAGAAAGIVLASAVLIIINAVWWLPAAREEGRASERTAALQKSMELIQERGKTNEAVRNLSPADICVELGGMFADGKCQ